MSSDAREHGVSWFRRAATTPARDWIRGRLTGRLDFRGRVRAELPTELADLVVSVVKRTRLWRVERAEVATELIAHFLDGMAAGARPGDLAARFGPEKIAARLIRRAKGRQRPAIWKAWVMFRRGAALLLLALIAVYLFLAARLFWGRPTLGRNYAAELSAEISRIPPEDRAYDMYIDAYASMDDPPRSIETAWPHLAPDHPAYSDALKYIEENRESIALMRAATARGYLGAPVSDAMDPRLVDRTNRITPSAAMEHQVPSENPAMLSWMLPHMGQMRAFARILTFEAHRAAFAGDADATFACLRDMAGLARHAGEQEFLIARLVGMAILVLDLRTTAEIVHGHPDLLSDDQLRDLAHQFSSSQERTLSFSLAGERAMFHDLVQRLYTDNGRGGGHITDEGVRLFTAIAGSGQNDATDMMDVGVLAPIATALVADRKSLEQEYTRVMAMIEEEFARPVWEFEGRAGAELDRRVQEDALYAARYLPVVALLPSVGRMHITAGRTRMERDATLTGIALELHRRREGRYPDSLDALVPGLLPAAPIDCFCGEVLRYDAATGRLWSTGIDRDDDGGRAPTGDRDQSGEWRSPEDLREALNRPNSGVDGDHLLWPRVYEPIHEDEREGEEAGASAPMSSDFLVMMELMPRRRVRSGF